MMDLNRLKASTKTLHGSLMLHNLINSIKVRKIFDALLLPFGFIKLKTRKAKIASPKYDDNRKLIIAAIVKDEDQYIEEWVQYHLLIGFDNFFIYDNSDNDRTFKSLKRFIDNGVVHYYKMPGRVRQMDAYNDALDKVASQKCYLMFLDADEFIFLKNKNDNLKSVITNIFNTNHHVGGLVLNWLVFGSSHFKGKPQGLVTQTYFYRSKYNFIKNKHVKTICDPQKVVGVLNPHYPEYFKGYYAVNLEMKRVEGAFNNPEQAPLIRINHYFTKSKSEFMKKKARGMADSNLQRGLNDFKIHDRNEVHDNSMKRYKKELWGHLLNNE